MITPGSANPLLAAGGEYQISRSLRFNSADSAYLNRTPASAGNRKTWTWSGWVKRSALGSFQNFMRAGSTLIRFTSSDTIQFEDNSVNVVTSAVYRDVSSYYHVVFAIDSTQATNTNRTKIYVNGVQQVLTGTYVTQNVDTAVNNTVAHYLGSSTVPSEFLSGYLTEVNFIDGQALTPSSFGETDPITGVWKPKKYTGTYGTNGFYLNFSDNSGTTATTLGKDYSGNGNNWTPNNFSVTAGAGNDSLVDVPTLWGSDTGAGGEVRGNYATQNPTNKHANQTLTNGNLDQVASAGGWNTARNTFPISSGKWYWEVTMTGSTRLVMHGVDDNTYNIIGNPSSVYVGAYNNSWSVYASDGARRNNTTTGTSYGSSFAQNDVMMVALDMDNGRIWWGKNGTWFNSGNPASGTNAAYTNLSGYTVTPATSCFDTTDSCSHNFGQRPFAHTAPSGFKALCTQNLQEPTIKQGDDYFNVVLYTGTGTTNAVTGVGFQPDLIWLKNRNYGAGTNHVLVDVIRGASLGLASNLTNAEFSTTGNFTSINSDGFTVAGTTHDYNFSTDTYVAWNWKANGAGVTNTAGTITSTVSANTTAGFSIVTWTNPTTSNFTVGHGLGVAPRMIITKVRNSTSGWVTYHASLGNTYALTLNTTAAQDNSVSYFNSTSPTSTVFTLGNIGIYGSGVTMVAYCFAAVPGYSAFGSYTGNGSTDGPFVFCNFRPRYVLTKRTDTANGWQIIDATRDPTNAVFQRLYTESSAAEAGGTAVIDFCSNGFKIRVGGTDNNASGGTYVYAAFAENPFKYSLAR